MQGGNENEGPITPGKSEDVLNVLSIFPLQQVSLAC